MNTKISIEDYKQLSQMDPHQLLCCDEVSRFLKISNKTLYRCVKEGLILCVKVKRNVKFEVREVLKYIETYRNNVQ